MLYTMYTFLTSDKKLHFTGNDWVFHNTIKLVFFLGQKLTICTNADVLGYSAPRNLLPGL